MPFCKVINMSLLFGHAFGASCRVQSNWSFSFFHGFFASVVIDGLLFLCRGWLAKIAHLNVADCQYYSFSNTSFLMFGV
jgi:hypothetical protein